MMLYTAILVIWCATSFFSNTIADNVWTLAFENTDMKQMEMGNSANILFYVYTNSSWQDEDLKVQVISTDENVAYAIQSTFDLPQTNREPSINFTFSFNLTTEFLGYTKLQLQIVELSESITY